MKFERDITKRGEEYGVIHYNILFNSRLSELFTQQEISSDFLHLLKLGSIYINNVRTRSDCLIFSNDTVRIHTQPRRFIKPESLSERIIFENDSILVLDKPAGIPVHALVDNFNENLITFLELELGFKYFITHRLDIETSGLFLLAKNTKVQSQINSLFATKQIKRKYQAFTEHILRPGLYTHFMKPTPTAPKIVTDFFIEGYQRCEMTIHNSKKDSRETFNNYWDCSITTCFVSEIELHTGRPQQIRSQLAHLEEPIIGDSSYRSDVTVKTKITKAPAIGLRSFFLDLNSLGLRSPLHI